MKGQMLLCLQKERLKESKNIKTKTKQAKNNSKLNKQTKKRIFFQKAKISDLPEHSVTMFTANVTPTPHI